MTPSTGDITHVSDTARWVAMYRAMETERPDAHFRDPFARRLAGPEGEAILQKLPQGKALAWPMVVRTQVMDEVILRAVSRDGADAVLNLAAGLDARPYRLALPASLRWVDADLPGILGYKQQQLAGETPRCALEFVPVDLTDASARRALFDRAGATSKQVMVVTEGLLGYLEREQVAELARDLAAQPSFRWWLTDLASPMLLERLKKRMGKSLKAAPFRFAPAEGTAFFAPHGWQELEYRSTFEESLRLNRTFPFARFWAFVGRFYPEKKRQEMKRFAGIVLFGRKAARP